MLDMFSRRQVSEIRHTKSLGLASKGQNETVFNRQGYLSSKQRSASKAAFSIILHNDMRYCVLK